MQTNHDRQNRRHAQCASLALYQIDLIGKREDLRALTGEVRTRAEAQIAAIEKRIVELGGRVAA